MSYLLDENQKKSNMSHMFLFLPSTLDRKEDIMQFKNNIHLHPIDVSYNSDAFLSSGGKIDPNTEFAWIDIYMLRLNKNFNSHIKFQS